MNIYTPLSYGLGNWIDGAEETSFEETDIVLIPGGSDVNPELYGHKRLRTTYVNQASDKDEWDLINKAIEAKKFIVGICKGSQMLTARAGGWLIQDVTGHGGIHEVETYDGKKFRVNSTHHQMCVPFDMPEEDYKLLAWSSYISKRYLIQDGSDMIDKFGAQEPEVIWYPKIRGLAIQSHPEWTSMPPEFTVWLNQIILELM